ncbi:MAG: hypothetical protein IKP67_08885 [Spirochaetales bacterium]|nr:hypothetical protein [Spirochaetales bacterium]
MSDVTMSDFIKMTNDFDYEQTVSAISILADKLKNAFVKEKQELSKEQKAINSLFARADSLHLCSDGTKWTREELYER